MPDVPDGVREVAVGIVAVAVLVMVLSPFVGAVGDLGISEEERNQTDALGVRDGSVSLASPNGDLESVDYVRTSLDDAVQLTGAPDSNVSASTGADLGQAFSACTWASANDSVVSNNETRVVLATQPAVIQYNGSADTWQGYYYNTSSGDSYRAAVAAPAPSTPTLVCLNHGGATLNVSANTSVGTNVSTAGANTAAYPTGDSWNGTVEETRLYGNGPLNASQRSEWVADPVLAVEGPAPGARITYDVFSGGIPSAFDVYFSDGEAVASNASLVAGQPGPSISEGADYDITSGGDLVVLDGGQLDANGEVLYASFVETVSVGPFVTAWVTLLNLGPTALGLLVVGLLVLGASFVMGAFDREW